MPAVVRDRRFRVCVLVSITVLAAVAVGADRSTPTVSFKPGTFKMLKLGGGGFVPAAGPVIRVEYDKTHRRYSNIDQKPLDLRATVIAACAKMKLEQLAIKTLGQEYPVSTSGLSHSHGVYTGTTTFTTNQVSTAALASVVPDPVATCNADMEAFVQKDQHGKVQKGWARQYDDALQAELVASCKGEETKKGGFAQPPPIATPRGSARFPVWVHCGAAPVFKVEGTSPKNVPVKKSGFQSASVFVNPPANADYRGACPKEIAFGGDVEYLLPPGGSSDIRYRYRTNDGGISPVFTTTITKSGKKNINYWKREFGGGGGNPSGNLAAPGAGSGTRVIDGIVRLEVLGPDGTVIGQDHMNFKVTCQPTRVSGDSAGPAGGGLASPPAASVGRATQARVELSDLVIRSTKTMATSPTTLQIEIANVGSAASQPTTVAVFYERSGHVVKKSFDVPILGPNQSRWITADLRSPLAHADRLTARVNDSGGAQESDMSNNARTIK